MSRAEWHGRSDFAEYAEAVGVSTTEVMAAMETERGVVCVLYSPGVTDGMDEEELGGFAIHRAYLLRNKDDRLLGIVKTERVGTLAEFRSSMDALMLDWKGDE
jgi:hypothetical protein